MHRRAGRPKSKTGCITCKIRHVKCDENKPSCHQCTSTGRKCDGYLHATQRQLRERNKIPNHHVAIASDSRIILRPGTREERQYVHLFCTQTAKALSGLFPSDFWLTYLPQLSQSEPVVRHAVAAVSAAHESRRLVGDGPPEQFVLQQYNKAIQQLREYLSTPKDQKLDLTLITCGLFICLEMLRGNHRQGLDHIEAGLRILQQRKQKALTGGLEVIDRDVSDLFLRLNLQLSLFGRSLVSIDDLTPTENTVSAERFRFDQFDQAVESMNRLMNRSLLFIRSVGIDPTQYPDLVHQLQLQEQYHLGQSFKSWAAGYNAMMKKAGTKMQFKKLDPRRPRALWINYSVSLIWLLTCLAGNQCAFDHHWDKFEDIITAAEDINQHNLSETQQSESGTDRFTVDACALPALYYTATKCRHPLLRRKALHLMTSRPRKEGMWDTGMSGKMAELVLEREEAGLSSLPVEQRVPAERDRIYELMAADEEDRNPLSVVLLRRLWGPDGGWQSDMESIHWVPAS